MALCHGERYDGIVMDAGLTQASTGTPGFWFKIKTDHGTINNDEWVTPATSRHVAKTMAECFGIQREQLSDMEFIEALGSHTRGAEVSIVIEEEENQNGEPVTKVKWMNPRGFSKKPPTPATLSRVAALFGGKSITPMPGRGGNDEPPPFNDFPEDAPF